MDDLKCFFNPGSVAVIGASARPRSPGLIVLSNFRRFNYAGKVYPVNPKGGQILGYKVYPSLLDVPGDVELVISLLGREGDDNFTLIEHCAQKGVKGLMIIAGGFSDAGAEGREREARLVALARQHGLRIIGPNTVGYANYVHNFVPSFLDANEPRRGPVSFVCQTGQFATNIVEWFMSHCRTGVSHCIDLGNKCDVDDADLLAYLDQDASTSVIGLYIEGFKEARRFLGTASDVGSRKPIVVYKAGRTKAGARATQSHTGAVATDDKIVDAALKQAGIVRACRLDEFLDYLRFFSWGIPVRGQRVGIITNTGAGGIMAVEAMEECGLQLAPLEEKTKEALREVYPSWLEVGNPVDLGPGIGIKGADYAYGLALEALDHDSTVDTILIISIVFNTNCYFVPDFGYVGSVCKVMSKPVVASITGSEVTYLAAAEILESTGVLTYPNPDVAARAIGAGYRYHERQAKKLKRSCFTSWERPGTNEKVRLLLQKSRGEANRMLGEREAKELLAEAGIPVNHCYLAESAAHAQELARKIGFPVVMKVASPYIVHKTEIGGVKLNCQDEEQVFRYYQEIITAAQPYDSQARVTVQKMLTPGTELMVGGIRDPFFGPVVVFGLGGVFVEILEDIAMRLAPLQESDAVEMIKEIKGYKLLQGYRNRPGVNTGEIKQLLLKVSELLTSYPEIRELDLNPVIAYPDHIVVVDARLVV